MIPKTPKPQNLKTKLGLQSYAKKALEKKKKKPFFSALGRPFSDVRIVDRHINILIFPVVSS
jgi:hypothetical protein